MRLIKYLLFGIIIGFILAWSWLSFTLKNDLPAQTSIPAVSTTASHQDAFNVIYKFYQALEKEEEQALSVYLTQEFLSELKDNTSVKKLLLKKQKDPSLRFAFFIIKDQRVDLNSNTIWVKGTAEWISPKEGSISFPQNITLSLSDGLWKIKSIKE